jgi:U4/U6.U5 tri-snRNP-associated protein 1
VEKPSFIHTAEQDEELYAQLARLRKQRPVAADYIANTLSAEDREMGGTNRTQSLLSSSIVDFVSRIGSVGDEGTADQERAKDFEETHMNIPSPEPVPGALQKRDEILEDITVDSGLSCALKFFHSRGMVDSADRTDRIHANDEDDIHIERRDEFGRSITDPKEAFKQLSWQFHGKKPGAKKQEKRLRKFENSRK